MNDITMLIQGNLTEDAIKFYIENYKNVPVIVSTWYETNDWICEYNLPKNFTLIINKQPSNNVNSRAHLQIQSTLYGLTEIKTEFVIKLRGDEYYSNLEYVVNLINEYPKHITTNSVFARKFKDFNWHVSDHLIAGLTSNLHLMFAVTDAPKNISLNPEQLLTTTFLQNKYGLDFINSTEPETIMKENFIIFDVNYLKPYKIVSNSDKKIWLNNFNNQENNCIISVEEMFYKD